VGRQLHVYTKTGTDTVTVTATELLGGQPTTTAWTLIQTFQVSSSNATSTTVAPSVNPSVYGQPVTLTAAVANSSPGGTGTPTGSVQFIVDNASYGQPVPLSSTGLASITVAPPLAAGPHSVVATYVPSLDGRFLASTSSPLLDTVNQDATTVAATSSAATSPFGQALTLAAKITANAPGAGTPTGFADFFDTTTGVDLGSVPLSGGSASISTANLPLGANTITVTYGGDSNFLGNNNAV